MKHFSPVVAVLLAVACAGPTIREPSREAVVFAHGLSGPKYGYFKEVFIDSFASVPGGAGIDSQFVSNVSGAYRQALLLGRIEADVVFLPLGMVPELAERGYLIPLDRLIQQREKLSGFFPNLLDAVRYRGKLYALPFDANTLLLYCNLDALAAADIQSPPRTWEEVGNAVRKVHDPPERWGIRYADIPIHMENFILQRSPGKIFDWGGRLEDVEKNEIFFALNRFLSNPFPRPVAGDPLADGFERGQVAMEIAGLWKLRGIQDRPLDFAWAAVPFPAGEETGLLWDSEMVVALFAKRDQEGKAPRQEAVEFLEHLFDPAVYARWSYGSVDVPPRTAICEAAAWRQLWPALPQLKAALEQVPRIRAIPLTLDSDARRARIHRALDQFAAGLMPDPAACVNEIVRVVEEDPVKLPATRARRFTPPPGALTDASATPARNQAIVQLDENLSQSEIATGVEQLLPRLYLAAAKGEHETFQLVFPPDPAGGGRVVRVEFAGLSGPGSAQFPPDRLQLYRAVDIPIRTPRNRAHSGLVPDALIPVSGSFPLDPDWPVIVFGKIEVRSDQPSGNYQGEIEIQDETGVGKTIEVMLRVFDFELPAVPSLKTSIGLNYTKLSDYYGLDPQSEEGVALGEVFYRFLVDRRLCPYNTPAPVAHQRSQQLLQDPRVRSFVMPYHEYEGDPSRIADELGPVRSEPWVTRKGYFYPYDEPTYGQYDQIRRSARALRERFPTIPYMLTVTPEPLLAEEVDIWCVFMPLLSVRTPSSYMEVEENLNALKQAQSKGKEVWWYTAAPIYPLPTLHIDDHPVAARVIPWLTRLYGFDAFLHWEAVNWILEDVYADPYVPGFGNGEGILIYPDPRPGSREPIPSLRLEMLAEGLEDYEYLEMLARTIRDRIPTQDLDAWEGYPEQRVQEFCRRLIHPEALRASADEFILLAAEFRRDAGFLDETRRAIGREIEVLRIDPLFLVRTDPPEHEWTRSRNAQVEVLAARGAAVQVNGKDIQPDREGAFLTSVGLRPGENRIRVTAQGGNWTLETERVVYRY